MRVQWKIKAKQRVRSILKGCLLLLQPVQGALLTAAACQARQKAMRRMNFPHALSAHLSGLGPCQSRFTGCSLQDREIPCRSSSSTASRTVLNIAREKRCYLEDVCRSHSKLCAHHVSTNSVL